MLTSAVVLVLAILILLAMQVDDWSRDFSTNWAATSIDAEDPTLRTLLVESTPEQITEAINRFVEQSSAWTVVQTPGGTTEASMTLVRTTKLFGFADDIQVFLLVTEAGTQIDVASRSRVGKGDLGQNPRNIRELLQAIRIRL